MIAAAKDCACPYCGSQNVASVTTGLHAYFECASCGARGPIWTSVEGARDAWNTRVFPVANMGKTVRIDTMAPVARLYTMGRHGASVSLQDGPGIPLITERSARKRIGKLRAALERIQEAEWDDRASGVAEVAMAEDDTMEAF